MKTWQWISLISIVVAFLTLLVSPLFMPMDWGIMAPMMGRGHGYWSGFYSPWGMSWLFVGLRALYWLLPVVMVTLLAMLFLDRQRHREVPEPVDKS